MAFSAAELQKRHGLEGAPDPFPTLGGGPSGPTPSSSSYSANKVSNGSSSGPSSAAPNKNNGVVDTSSEDAFPSLGASSAPPAQNLAKPAASMWATKSPAIKAGPTSVPGLKSSVTSNKAAGMGRGSAPTASTHTCFDSFSLPAADLETGKALAETLQKVKDQTGAIVESSVQMKTGLKTFLIKASDQKRLVYARRLIERGLSKSTTIEVEVPISTLGTIIGPKGATLKSITESTTCKIDIPRRDTLPAWDGPKDGRKNGEDENDSDDDDDDDDDEEPEEPLVAIQVTGPSVACQDAKAKILGLISHRVSQSSTSIKTIPSSYYPFIAGVKGAKARQLEQELGGGEVKVHVPPPAVWKALEKQASAVGGDEDGTGAGASALSGGRDVSIKVRGEKEKVKLVVSHILQQYEELADSLRELKISIPKRQHRFLVGAAADDILEQTGCIVELPPVDDASDLCVIRGPQPALVPALTLVMDKANAVAVEMVDVVALHRSSGASDALAHAKRVLRYLVRSSRLRNIADAHNDVKVYPPFASAMQNSGTVVIEVVGANKSEVAKVKDEIATAVKAVVPSAVKTVEVDYVVHSLLIGKKGSKIGQFEAEHGVTTVFPPASDESSEVMLFFAADSATNAGLPSDKKARDAKIKDQLAAAAKALQELAKGAADISTETLKVDKKWHRYIIGQGGKTLNDLIGEDQLVNVKVGSKAGSSASDGDDTVVVRGPKSEVERVVEQIKQIVEDAKNDDLVNGYTVEFTVDKKHVPHLVGKSGETINKLRETLGVRVNFDDEPEVKGKKPRVKCKIVGKKDAVDEARRRLDAQVEKLEDETTDVITIKRAIQPALIGSGGKYAIRLEEKYGVKLSFPRDGQDSAKPDEVTIRGGKKGVAAAKAELLEAAAFETESRQSLTFTIPTKSVAQVVGKGGATINGIKDESGAQIDIDKNAGDDGKTTVTVRGDKKAVAAAKAAVLAVAEQAGDETTVTLTIDPKYHRTLIGQGGQKLRDLIVACGGPEEGFKQAGLITFPRNGASDDQKDQVRLRGDKKLVAKIQAELEKTVAQLKQTIVRGVVVPASQHASKIGRGGAALQALQRDTNTTVHFPGSRGYASAGDVDNADELGDAPSSDIVKVIGTKEACAKAAESLSTFTERSGPGAGARGEGGSGRGGAGRNASADYVSREISIPTKYYHAIADQQNLLRTIRSAGGQLSLPQPAPARPSHTASNAGEPSSSSSSLAAKTARIDLDADESSSGGAAPAETGHWEVRENYSGGDELGETVWVVRAKEEDLDRVADVLNRAVDKAKASSHVGFLTGLPRNAFPRIIGSKGATITRLRTETGADIQVGKDDDLITITGDLTSINLARDEIVNIISRPSRF